MSMISVALPVYNGANYLGEALDSILAQDYADFELVVSDNCSTDETPQILAEYASRDSRIRFSRSDEVLSQAANVNRAVELCSREWVKLFCHDDIMHPSCMRVMSNLIREVHDSPVGLIGSGWEWLFGNGYCYVPPELKRQKGQRWNGAELNRGLLQGVADVCLPALTTATVKKKAWEEAGRFDVRFAHFDIFLWTRLLMNWEYVWVPEPVVTIRIHAAQVAVSARRNLRSVSDHKIFWGEFTEEFGSELNLDSRSRIKVRLKPVAIAASAIAIEILKGNLLQALTLPMRMPPTWWPLLPALVARSYRMERRRMLALRGAVPVADVYP